MSTVKGNQNLTIAAIIGIAALAIVARFVTEIPNFAPFGALALFAGAYLRNKTWAFVLPLGALMVSDIVMEIKEAGTGFYPEFAFVYASYLLVILLGFGLRGNKNIVRVAGASLAGSLLFFLLSNFGVWATTNFYPATVSGLMTCYEMAIPFMRSTFVSDLAFNAVLFGGMYLVTSRKFSFAKA